MEKINKNSKFFYKTWVGNCFYTYRYPVYVESEKELTDEEVMELAKKQVIDEKEADTISDEITNISESEYHNALSPRRYVALNFDSRVQKLYQLDGVW